MDLPSQNRLASWEPFQCRNIWKTSSSSTLHILILPSNLHFPLVEFTGDVYLVCLENHQASQEIPRFFVEISLDCSLSKHFSGLSGLRRRHLNGASHDAADQGICFGRLKSMVMLPGCHNGGMAIDTRKWRELPIFDHFWASCILSLTIAGGFNLFHFH